MSDPPASSALPLRRDRSTSGGLGLSVSPNTLTVLDNGSGPSYSIPQSPIESQIRVPESSSGRHFSGSFIAEDNVDDYQLGEEGGNDDGGGGAGGTGLGNLADELAEAWSDEEGDDNDNGQTGARGGRGGGDGDADDAADEPFESSYIDSLQHLGPGPSTSDEPEVSSPRLKKPTSIRGHAHLQGHHGHRKTDSGRSLYDGSDYGNDSDFEESTDLSPALEQRMASIDNLVRFSLAESRTGGDQVVERMIEGLRDLGGSQGRLETSASRLITAHGAIASHLAHQTRTLQTLTHPLLYSHLPILSTDAIDDLLALIDDLVPTLPFPTPIPSAVEQSQQHSQSPLPPSSSPPLDPTDLSEPPDLSDPEVLASTTTTDLLISLQALLAQTSDITHALRFISDTIHESRQLTSIASRRLKNVRELVADIRREDEGREEGTRFIEKGDWDRKLSDREAGKECKDVVSGFEEVCGVWRERLFGQDPGTEAVAAV